MERTRGPRRNTRLAPHAVCALAIGGIDPGGGAGVVADLRAFAAAGAFGCAAVAVLTVQSTAGLRRVRAVGARELSEQCREVLVQQDVRAIKVGALGTAENVRAVGRLLALHASVPAVVDTPVRATRGRGRLLTRKAVDALRAELLPRATVLTVNTEEAAILVGAPVRALRAAHEAARALAQRGPRAVVVKGGHLEGASAIDVVALGTELIELRARRLARGPLHGSGCTFASLIAGRLATRKRAAIDDDGIVEAIRWSKRVHHAAIAGATSVGEGSRVLVFGGPFTPAPRRGSASSRARGP